MTRRAAVGPGVVAAVAVALVTAAGGGRMAVLALVAGAAVLGTRTRYAAQTAAGLLALVATLTVTGVAGP